MEPSPVDIASTRANHSTKWPTYKKTMILIVCSAYSFIGNCALLGISPYIQLFSAQFGVSPTVASTLISYPNLAFGFSASSFRVKTNILGTLLTA
jgi:hypothetical protein